MHRLAALALLATSSFAQVAPSFEVASVRRSPSEGPNVLDVNAGSLTMGATRMKAILRWAFDVQESQIIGPEWLDENVRFDISAQAAASAREPELRRMLQTLLADRFKLAAHPETRPLSAFVLTVAKGGHKLKPATGEGPPSWKTGRLNLTGERATVAQLTEFLSRQVQAPIIDQTGLTGSYNYFLDILSYMPEQIRETGQGALPLQLPGIVANALQEQLGLKLDSAKSPVPVIIIDHIEKEPTEN